MSERIFLLGVGAQKAGTSWIQDHLSRSPEADFGPLKEYHVFNALHLPHYAHVAARRDPSPLHQPKRFFHYLIRGRRWPTAQRIRQRLRQRDAYYSQFEQLLSRPGITLTGDITPDYSGLPADILRTIHDNFARRDIAVRALFLMRDPVERCISAVRMYRGRPSDSHMLSIDPSDTTANVLRSLHTTRHFELLTRYDLTFENLLATFEEQAILTGFYEELFTQPEVCRIEAFCGISHISPEFTREVNVSGFKNELISSDVRAIVARHFRPVYDFAAARWGKNAMEARWTGYQYL